MKIYLISQNANNGYDTFNSAVVIAKDEDRAKRIHPNKDRFDVYYKEDKKGFYSRFTDSKEEYLFEDHYGSWINDLSKIKVEYIGDAKEEEIERVVCASFNAG